MQFKSQNDCKTIKTSYVNEVMAKCTFSNRERIENEPGCALAARQPRCHRPLPIDIAQGFNSTT